MKIIKHIAAKLTIALLLALVSIASFAQEKGADLEVTINKDQGANWYTSPWVWVVGAAVFILLLVALLRGRGSKE